MPSGIGTRITSPASRVGWSSSREASSSIARSSVAASEPSSAGLASSAKVRPFGDESLRLSVRPVQSRGSAGTCSGSVSGTVSESPVWSVVGVCSGSVEGCEASLFSSGSSVFSVESALFSSAPSPVGVTTSSVDVPDSSPSGVPLSVVGALIWATSSEGSSSCVETSV